MDFQKDSYIIWVSSGDSKLKAVKYEKDHKISKLNWLLTLATSRKEPF